MKKSILFGLFVSFVSIMIIATMPGILKAIELTPIEELGKALFFDENLSIALNQSCATCHAPEFGFTGPDSDINAGQAIYPGSILTMAGNRKPPTAAYGGESPVLDEDEDGSCFFVGGMFWDGRATGWTLDDPLTEQALGPFLNFLEQANPKAKLVCIKVKYLSDYADLYEKVWEEPLDCSKEGLADTYDNFGRSIAAYERSDEVNPFGSKFDAFVTAQGGDVSDFGIEVITIGGEEFRRYVGPPAGYSKIFSEQEARGLAIFNADSYTQQVRPRPDGQDNGGVCYACHLTAAAPTDKVLFTDFTYDNLGIPKNPQNPFYDAQKKYNPDGEDWIDLGLGGFLASIGDETCASENWGKHKVPTLRNVDRRPSPGDVKAYGHNGYFKSLEEIVSFYNTRDSLPWPDPPEFADTVNIDELGNLVLSPAQVADLVAFMKTLNDGYIP